MKVELKAITPKEMIPGFRGRFVHMKNYTLAFWEVEEGAELPEHSHPNEQTSQVIEGRFELVIDGKTETYEAGQVATIPGNIVHSGRALTPCTITDVFSPARPEYSND